jgi:hypothetical protein
MEMISGPLWASSAVGQLQDAGHSDNLDKFA